MAAALLDAAEELIQRGGVEGLSVRAVADRVGTTTRAVYTVYGSRAGLLAALGERAFEILGAGITAVPATDDPGADLVEAAVSVFRRFALEHPSLFRIGVQQVATPSEVTQRFRPSAQTAFAELEERIARLGVRSVGDAALAFHAMCEGMAAVELRCMIDPENAELLWRGALAALVAGLARQDNHPPSARPSPRQGRARTGAVSQGSAISSTAG
jgi:AcrR family transcriptional regulator